MLFPLQICISPCRLAPTSWELSSQGTANQHCPGSCSTRLAALQVRLSHPWPLPAHSQSRGGFSSEDHVSPLSPAPEHVCWRCSCPAAQSPSSAGRYSTDLQTSLVRCD